MPALADATAAFTPGQILGGRWKPLHYWYKKSLFTRVFVTCGTGNCMVKNDASGPLQGAALTVSKVEFATGVTTVLHSEPALALPAGPGAAAFFTIDSGIDGSAFALRATVAAADGTMLTDNFIPLLPPVNWTLPRASVTFEVAPLPEKDGSINVKVTSDKVAAFVTLTTMAQGRFTDNAFFMAPGTVEVGFVPWAEGQYEKLVETLRVEHMASYM